MVGFDDYVSKFTLTVAFGKNIDSNDDLFRHGPGKRDGIVRLGRRVGEAGRGILTIHSDYSGNHTELPKILLNGNNICMVWHGSHSNLPFHC